MVGLLLLRGLRQPASDGVRQGHHAVYLVPARTPSYFRSFGTMFHMAQGS